MNRRGLLLGSAAAAISLSVPGWALVFEGGPSSEKQRERVSILRAARAAAKRRGRPLLVLIGDPDRNSESVRRWTYFLDSGATNDLAELALCDLVCSVREDLAREFPVELREFPADAMAILIAADNQGFACIGSSGPVPRVNYLEHDTEACAVSDHISAVARALRERIAGDRATLERRAASSNAALTGEELLQLDAARGVGPTALATQARLAPAELALRARDDPKSAQACIAALANEATLRWRVGRPPGARWATRGAGCSADRLEGSPLSTADRVSGPCGTGFAPHYSQRFLWFYAEHQRLAFEDAPKR